jgi:23S rRNA pseudouridine1911/1915/1917 synthase
MVRFKSGLRLFRSVQLRRNSFRLASTTINAETAIDIGFLPKLLPTSIESWSGTSDDVSKLIVFEDFDIAVFWKPGTVLSQRIVGEDDIVEDQSLWEMYRQYQDQDESIPNGVAHRMDRPVSGLIVYGKHAEAITRLNDMFRDRQVEKKYLCVVNGEVTQAAECTNYLLKTRSAKTAVIKNPVQDLKNGTTKTRPDIIKAELNYRPLLVSQYLGLTKSAPVNATEVTNKKPSTKSRAQSLLEITLLTGRKHQIRAQLSHRGYPIVGDIKYQAPQQFKERDIALHAASLAFKHPMTRKPMRFVADLPRIWFKRFSMTITDAALQWIEEEKSKLK